MRRFLRRDRSRDSRRTIREVTILNRWVIQHFTVHETSTLGGKAGHFHQHKDEWFLCLQGGGTIYLVDQDTNCHWKVKFGRGTWVKVERRVAHRFDMTDGTVFMCLANAPFDPADNINVVPPIEPW